MKISTEQWATYTRLMSALKGTARRKMLAYITEHGMSDMDAVIDYAFGLATKYGEGTSAAAAEMYDSIARAQNANVPAAEVAATASYTDTAKAVTYANGIGQQMIPGAVETLVKQAGEDTMLKNAVRDGAEFAWVPHGSETCAMCITIASNGWRRASKKTMKGDHADHIHSSCDCEFAIRFDGKSTVEGYDPDKYLKQYENAEGNTWKQKVNSMRRDQYKVNGEKIRAQKRAAYERRTGALREESHKDKIRDTEISRSKIESADYGRRMSAIDDSRDVTNIMTREAKRILNHRSGTEYEDLIFIDTRTGKYITRTDYNRKRGVLPSNRMMKMLQDAPEYTVATLHNHPGSTAPSPADIHVIYKRKNKYGVVVCHDGTIYKYSIDPERYNEPGYWSAFAYLDEKGYNNNILKEYIKLSKEAGVNIEVK